MATKIDRWVQQVSNREGLRTGVASIQVSRQGIRDWAFKSLPIALLVYRRKYVGPLIIWPGQSAFASKDCDLFGVESHWELDGHSEG